MTEICIYFLRFVVLAASFLIMILYLLLSYNSSSLMPNKDRSSSGAFPDACGEGKSLLGLRPFGLSV